MIPALSMLKTLVTGVIMFCVGLAFLPHFLKDLKLSPAGREVGQRDKTVAGRDNRAAVTSLLNKAINEHLGIKSGSRKSPDAGDNEDALAALDMLGDNVRDSLKGRNDG